MQKTEMERGSFLYTELEGSKAKKHFSGSECQLELLLRACKGEARRRPFATAGAISAGRCPAPRDSSSVPITSDSIFRSNSYLLPIQDSTGSPLAGQK